MRPKRVEETRRPYTADNMWWSFIQKNKLSYLLGALSVGITGTCQVLIPRCVGWGVDLLKGENVPAILQRGSKVESFEFLFLCLLLAHVFLLLARMGWRKFLASHTFYSGSWLRRNIWNKVRYLPKARLEKDLTVGVLMNASTSDVNTARYIFGFTLVAVFDVVFLGLFTLGAMFLVDVEMTLWTLVIFPLLPLFIRKLSDKEGEEFDSAQESLSSFNDLCSQAIATIRLQRLTQTGRIWEKKLLQSASEYREKRLKAAYASVNFIPCMGVGTVISFVILFLVGINKVFQGGMTVGEFVVMQSYVILIQDPLMELGYIVSEWQRARTSLNRLANIYNEEEDQHLRDLRGPSMPVSALSPSSFPSATSNPSAISEDQAVTRSIIKMENLSFQYPGSRFPLFEGLNLDLLNGERLGVTGPIGTGKTTLLNLISGLEQQHRGTIHFQGRPFIHYTHKNLRTRIALVPQRPFLFADTIRNNVALDRQMSDEEIWHYLNMAGLSDDVKGFPLGLSTPLGEWGINLSGGQKQRLTIARALAHRPQLLLLDDCLSAVDTVTEERILRNLDGELKESSLVWVAHRKSTLKYCDKIIDLK